MATFCSAHGNLVAAIIFLLSLTLTPFSLSLNFRLSSFSPDDTAILLEGDAVISVGKIELNKVNYIFRVGRVIYNGKVPLWEPNSAKRADFTTRFSFIIDTLNKSAHGHGLAFFLAPAGFEIPPNSGGAFLGLFNTTTSGSSQSQIVAVEFDTFANSGEWDPPYEHVGINNNSIASSVTTPWNVSLHDGETTDVWISYSAATTNLTVFWSYNGAPNSTLSYQVDLREVLPQWVTVGITAATGSNLNIERHILESWEFSSSLDIKEGGRNDETNIALIVGLAIGACVLITAAVVAYVVVKKRRYSMLEKAREAAHLSSIGDDLERGAGPRRFSYQQLALATNNFSQDRKQGEGGFGAVYKGHLIDLDTAVAVKKISKGSRQGKKEYIAEVKTIGMLRHRNLVQLIGWCHDQGEFMLVYEFLPNGSLDHHLFGRKTALNWSVRYRVAIGLASALLYLHEEWEQCVVHRDIKSSNVMLDSSFNVKLGDFGLARLMDHGIDPKTTGLAGTLGYLAPEYVSSGRASKESDVYSFGVVALEIATGRRSTDALDERGLVAWVWDLYGNGELLSGVDGKLQGDFDPRQVERVMVVGLWCAHPDRNLRSSIREACHVLNSEKEVPKLPSKMPTPVYYAPAAAAVAAPVSTSSAGSTEPFITSSSINIGR
ncbi:L-type lectin-domain containing receptor kinase IX.1-like [Salvia miltiorrhiza]|uniref:L-type lectin-domain containing receptor kinase IX.1-like n=1 Tax=Salvia miltiorrhiza TaxID=226208 RepID=UPI0025AC29B7|nr:L-type lectin-domain containing receptor kinase IX.1-like [Salvia miltiorrhiza]